MKHTRTIQGVSNGLPHTTYRLPLGTPWMVQVGKPGFEFQWSGSPSFNSWEGISAIISSANWVQDTKRNQRATSNSLMLEFKFTAILEHRILKHFLISSICLIRMAISSSLKFRSNPTPVSCVSKQSTVRAIRQGGARPV